MISQTRMDCPWDTIRMVPTPTVAGDQTSLDSQSNREHPIFEKTSLLPEEVRTPFILRGEKPAPPPPAVAAAVVLPPKPSAPPLPAV